MAKILDIKYYFTWENDRGYYGNSIVKVSEMSK